MSTAVADRLITKLATLGISAEHVRTTVGPQIERFELTTSARMREVARTADDLAYELGLYPVRVVAPLPGHPRTIAVEVPTQQQLVKLADLPPGRHPLEVSLGVDMDGNPVPFDLTQAPHTLVAGQTGSGKTGCLNCILGGALSALSPRELGLVLIDPKQVELARYGKLPHLLTGVADSVEAAIQALEGTIRLMELRFQAMRIYGARDLNEMNAALVADGREVYPRILVVVDELADLMTASRKVVEPLVARIGAKARAVGIHLVLATQSPRVQVVTGLIKANVPTRICFSVASMTDSRVVLDRNGAEKLLGRGDGLLSMGGAEPVRFQSAWVSSEEIEQVCARWQ
jgi:S-DNA-T family DNA segregation ATPase FtsK/SpoIIIE